MGDRTYCQVEIGEAHVETLQPVFEDWGFRLQEEDCHPAIFEDSEADDGGSECIEALQAHKLPFRGYHDSGGNYGPAIFAFDGETFESCCGLEGSPMCAIDPATGDPEPGPLATVRTFIKVDNRARALINAATFPEEEEEDEDDPTYDVDARSMPKTWADRLKDKLYQAIYRDSRENAFQATPSDCFDESLCEAVVQLRHIAEERGMDWADIVGHADEMFLEDKAVANA